MTLKYEFSGLYKIISGGQTGSDQGGLIAAAKAGVETGGTAPEHYKTQDGLNPLLSLLGLVAEGDYASRTKKNVLDSDGTVIIAANVSSPGTVLTKNAAINAQRPYLMLDIVQILKLSQGSPKTNAESALQEVLRHAQRLKDFVELHRIGVLNVAGNRELRSTGEFGALPITTAAEWIVAVSLELLDLDGHLIRSKNAPFEL